MSRGTAAQRTGASSALPPWYPEDLLPQIQQALGELADIEFRYESEVDHIRASAAPAPVRQRLAAALVRRYHSERRPCLERLARLQKQMITAKLCEDFRRTA